MSITASAEAMRIVRTLHVDFPSGPSQTGSAFVANAEGHLLTCAHVVLNKNNQRATRILAVRPDGTKYEATLQQVNEAYDLARLESTDRQPPPFIDTTLPLVGKQVIFAGLPQGIARASVFPGMVSAVGDGLITRPRCQMVQIAGMINNGNSGGPLLDAQDNKVIGLITAKYVPLLQNIDLLAEQLEAIPQFPRAAIIGKIDFSGFVNDIVKSMWQIAAVLRLSQVGTGWAVPSKYFEKVGVN